MNIAHVLPINPIVNAGVGFLVGTPHSLSQSEYSSTVLFQLHLAFVVTQEVQIGLQKQELVLMKDFDVWLSHRLPHIRFFSVPCNVELVLDTSILVWQDVKEGRVISLINNFKLKCVLIFFDLPIVMLSIADIERTS